MLPFLDSHAHLADPAFDADRDAVIENARAAGAAGIVCIGESIAAGERAARAGRRHPGFVWFTAGVHPHDAAEFDEPRDRAAIRDLAMRGVGRDRRVRARLPLRPFAARLQRRAFAAQLAIARELDRPVVVHTREAEDDTRAMVVEAGAAGVRGVLHCYTGTAAPRRGGALGRLVRFVQRHRDVQEVGRTTTTVIRLVPADRLLVESDSPYLAPVPNRGRRNEPAWVSLTVARVAAVRGVDPSTLGDATVAKRRALVRTIHLSEENHS